MDAKRKAEMIVFTRELLDEATKGRGIAERLNWLFAHLEEYLERWRGFANIDGMSIEGVIGTDLHVVLLIGVALIDEEMEKVDMSAHLRIRWNEFSELAYAINAQSSKEVGSQLSKILNSINVELAKGITFLEIQMTNGYEPNEMWSFLRSTSFLLFLALTPFLLVITYVIAHGGGTSVPARIILPWASAFLLVADPWEDAPLSSTVLSILLFIQFPAYGAILGGTKTNRQFAIALGIVIALHVMLSLLCFIVPDPR